MQGCRNPKGTNSGRNSLGEASSIVPCVCVYSSISIHGIWAFCGKTCQNLEQVHDWGFEGLYTIGYYENLIKKPWVFIWNSSYESHYIGVIGPGFLNQVPTVCERFRVLNPKPLNPKPF